MSKEVWERIVEERKKKAFLWPYLPSQPTVEEPRQEEPPVPSATEEPPKPVGQRGDQTNVASRILAEGFDFPGGEPPSTPTEELSPNPLSGPGGDAGSHQAKLLQRRKNDLGSFSI